MGFNAAPLYLIFFPPAVTGAVTGAVSRVFNFQAYEN